MILVFLFVEHEIKKPNRTSALLAGAQIKKVIKKEIARKKWVCVICPATSGIECSTFFASDTKGC
jgi:hypothetical protein